MTGKTETMAKTPKIATEPHDTASPLEDKVCNIVPARIATKDGGATPGRKKKFHSHLCNNSFTTDNFATISIVICS